MSCIGIAVIGVGDVAQRDYLPEFHRIGDRCRLVSVVSRSEERAKSVAATFNSEQWTTDAAAAITHPDVDLVVNLTPVHAHHEVSLAAIRAGKHLYSEKPLADTTAQAAEIRKEALRAEVAVAAAPSVAVFPQVRLLADLLGGERIGKVCSVRAASYGGVPPWAGYRSDPRAFFVRGAGPLRDMGVYPLHALVALFGAVRSVSAHARHTIDSFEIVSGPYAGSVVPVESPDDWHLTVETHSGVVADIHASFASNGGLAPEFEVLGREGTAGVSLLDVASPIEILTADGESESLPVEHVRSGGPDHILGVEHLVEHVVNGAPLVLDVETAQHVLSVIESAEVSASEGTTLYIPDFTSSPNHERTS